MRRIAALLAIVAVSAIVAVPAVAADGPVKQFPQSVTLGFYRGQVISYLDFGPVKLTRGNRVAPIWVVTNGVEEQRNIIDTVPGRRDYTPLWSVRMVTWKGACLATRPALEDSGRRGRAGGPGDDQGDADRRQLPCALRGGARCAPHARTSRSLGEWSFR